ncbi:MAG: mechanosensitive ion channel family protein [Chloroflexota bacterium]|nr:mechanosensitive ion channel family protein [Chloroflexota bacterium]
MSLNELLSWIVTHGLALVVGGIILFALYRFAVRMTHRVVVGLLQVQNATLQAGSDPAEEQQKRAVTLEVVLGKLIRAGFLVALVILVLGVFDLWQLLAGLGLVAAALTLAGQAIVLDYLMGILILVEGPFYKGDWIAVQAAPGATTEGEVEEIGLRRTTLRDGVGALHSVSNGLIRLSSNMTRVYSIAAVDVQILRPQDLDRAIAVAGRVGRALGDDPAWSGRLFESPIDTWVTALTLDGAAITIRRRVPPDLRLAATSELRRRLSVAFAAESIGTGRWDTPPAPDVSVATATGSPGPEDLSAD